MATVIIYFILQDLFNIDKKIGNNNFCELKITMDGAEDSNNKIKIFTSTITNANIRIVNTEINVENKMNIIIGMTLQLPLHKSNNDMLEDLLELEFVKKASVS